jgi:hypothetical protein
MTIWTSMAVSKLPIGLALLVALAACGTSAIAGQPSPAAGDSCRGAGCTITRQPSSAASPDDAFMADILDTPGLSSTMDRADVINLGHQMCKAIPEAASHADFVAQVGASKLGPGVVDVILTSAEKHLCPNAVYGTESGPTAAASPSGPLTTISAGTYEVGTGPGQVAPGKYRAPGPDGSNFVGCYYARLRNNDGSFGDIVSNNISKGQSLLTVKASDGYVVVNGCTFTKV